METSHEVQHLEVPSSLSSFTSVSGKAFKNIIPPVRRGQPLRSGADAPPIRREILPSGAAAPPVGRGQPHLTCHMMVSYDLFNFLTHQVGTAPIVRSVETEQGYLTTVTVQGLLLF